MLKSIILIILKLSPSSKKWFWEKWYNIFARNAKNTNLKLMNYGFHSPGLELKLQEEDEIERYPIQLYSFVTNQADVRDKNILEVGNNITQKSPIEFARSKLISTNTNGFSKEFYIEISYITREFVEKHNLFKNFFINC